MVSLQKPLKRFQRVIWEIPLLDPYYAYVERMDYMYQGRLVIEDWSTGEEIHTQEVYLNNLALFEVDQINIEEWWEIIREIEESL